MLEFEFGLQHPTSSQISEFGDAHILMQVHDELIFEVGKEINLVEFANLLHHCMSIIVCRRLSISIPLPVDIQVGSAWGSMSTFMHSTITSHAAASTSLSLSMDIETIANANSNTNTNNYSTGIVNNPPFQAHTESQSQGSSNSRCID